MKAYLRTPLRFYAMMVALPVLLGLGFAWDDGAFALIAFILVIPVALLTLLGATVLFTVHGVRLAREANPWRVKLVAVGFAPALSLALVLGSLALLSTGTYLGTATRLLANQHRFAATLAKLAKNPTFSGYVEDDGLSYEVDPGPPLRVAFNPKGLLDNWSGIVYDPTDDVMLADGFDPKTGRFVAPERVTKLFGGDLVSCRALWSHYYTCSFT